MYKHVLAAMLFGALVLTGAGCAGKGGTNTTTNSAPSNSYSQSGEVNVEEETPDLSADSSAEEVEAVVNEIEDLSGDVQGMSTSTETMEKANAEL